MCSTLCVGRANEYPSRRVTAEVISETDTDAVQPNRVGLQQNCVDSTASTSHARQGPSAQKLATCTVEGRGVFAVARLDSNIFLLQTEDDIISIYADSEPYNKIDTRKIRGMTNPSDMLACKENNSLYVPDDRPNPGYKVRTKDGPPLTGCLWYIQNDKTEPKQLLTELGDWRPRALSRTSSGSHDRPILITTKHDKRLIYVCDLTGILLEELFLPDLIFEPEHIIQGFNTDSEFIVCHRVHKGDKTNQIVKLIRRDKKDKTLTIPYPNKHDDLNLDRPEHMVQLSDGRIIVADYYNDRVLLLLPNFKLQKILLCKNDGIDRPCRLSVSCDDEKCELLVASHHTADLFELILPGMDPMPNSRPG